MFFLLITGVFYITLYFAWCERYNNNLIRHNMRQTINHTFRSVYYYVYI